jgi:hypothetical protein
MKTPLEDDIITNSDESRKLPDNNPEPLTGIKKDESNLLEEEPKINKTKEQTSNKPEVEKKKEMK